ncbi:MAG: caspase family protein [Marmoricola sp.]
MIEDAVTRLRRIELKTWVYTRDANLGKRKWDSMHDAITRASSIAFFVGPQGTGMIQEQQELDWAMDGETYGDTNVFIVLMPDVSPEVIPPKFRNPAQIRLLDADVEAGRLTATGFAKLCAGIRAANQEEATEWIRFRERELFLSPPQRARALLVGICEYDDAELANLTAPGRDIDELEMALSSLQLQGGVVWEVAKLHELTEADLVRELRTFYLEDVDPDDLLLFYFSGHGTTSEGSTYFLPRDAQAARPATSGGVRADTLREYLRETPAWASVVILDCCHGDLGGPDAGTYEALPERSAVLGASPGPTGASGPDRLSPFTSALVRIIREADALTMAELETRLKAAHSSAWAQVGTLGRVEKVTLGRARQRQDAIEPSRFTQRMTVGTSTSDRARVELLARLSQTLDALLAATPQRSAEMDEVIRKTLEVIAAEMQVLTSRPDQESKTWAELNQMDPRALVEVFFSEKDMRTYAGLPWEYLGVTAGGSLDWLLRSRVCRVIPVAATKSPPTGKMQSPLVLSAPPPDWGPGLKELTRLETEWVHQGSFVGEAHWGHLQKSKPDLLAIQCGLTSSGEMSMNGMTVDFLKAGIATKPVRAIVIETVAGENTPCAGVSVRELAYEMSLATSRSVIAVCHQTGYLAKLNEIVLRAEEYAPAGPSYSFIASLAWELMSGAKVEEAAYTARHNVVMALGPDTGPFVGIPVTVRADPRQTTGSSQRYAPASTRRHTQTDDPQAPDTSSRFGS